MKLYKIGELSKKINLSIDTIRYYEKIGLIPKPERQKNEYRVYSDIYIYILDFIKCCKDNGFTLNEINEIIGLIRLENRDNKLLESIIKQKLQSINDKIEELKIFKNKLHEIIVLCNEDECCLTDFISSIQKNKS